MDGVQLGARFSIATNRLNYCGPAEAEPLLYRAIVDGTDGEAAGRALLRFEALAPYLETIARHHGLDPLDRRVVEAYWIGNELLDTLGRPEFRELLTALTRRGLPRATAEQLDRELPAHPLLHHAFHVAFVGVGNVTGHVPTTLANVEACRPALVTVEGLPAPGRVRVRRPKLRVDDGRLRRGPSAVEELPIDPRVVPEAAPGRRLVVHWGWPALGVEDGQASRLEEYTDRALEAANEALPRLGTFTEGSRSASGRTPRAG